MQSRKPLQDRSRKNNPNVPNISMFNNNEHTIYLATGIKWDRKTNIQNI